MTTTAPAPISVVDAEVVNFTKTRVIFIIDSSGSMSGQREAVVTGFNNFLTDLAQNAGNIIYRVSAVHFATDVRLLYLDQPITKAPLLMLADYKPSGMTALLDAIGGSIVDVVPEEGERILVVIQTDGQENISTAYNLSQIKEMIEERQASGRWAFVFLMANATQFAAENTARGMGIERGSTVAYSDASTGSTFSSVSATAQAYATGAYTYSDLGQTIQVDDVDEEPTD